MSRQSTDYRELLEKYNLLLSENRRLIKENDRLKAQLGIAERKPDENRIAGPTTEKSIHDGEPTGSGLFSDPTFTRNLPSWIKKRSGMAASIF